MATPKIYEVTCPHCGETFEFEAAPRKRGQLAGIELIDMTDEQLSREIINASSVLAKAKARGASEDTIAKNQARLDAAKAEREARKALNAPAVEDVEEVSDEAVYADAE